MDGIRKQVKHVNRALRRGRRFIVHDVWLSGMGGEQVRYHFLIKQMRVTYLLARGIMEETLLLRASALTFATLLFIVPFLTFVFYFIQTFNLGDQVYQSISLEVSAQVRQLITMVSGETEEKRLLDLYRSRIRESHHDPKPPRANSSLAHWLVDHAPPDDGKAEADQSNNELEYEIISALFPILDHEEGLGIERVGNKELVDPVETLIGLAEDGASHPWALGFVGVFAILSTVFGFMRNVESAFNQIWGVKRTRNMLRAVTDFFMVALIMPFVLAGLLGVTAALANESVLEVLGPFAMVLRGAQFFLVTGAFVLVYYYVPNAPVQLRYAVPAGLFGSLLWSATSWGFVEFQIGVSRNAWLFGSFALFPLAIMWIYVSWLILLFGCLVCYAYQNERTFAMERVAEGASFAYREAVAMRAMIEMARRFQHGMGGLQLQEAAETWQVPQRLLSEVLESLGHARMVVICATDPITYQPARDPGRVTVREVVRVLREDGHDPSLLRGHVAYVPLFEALSRDDDECMESSIATLATQLDEAESEGLAQIVGAGVGMDVTDDDLEMASPSIVPLTPKERSQAG